MNLRWLGNKYRYAPAIVRLFPSIGSYDTYIEPFCGVAGIYRFAKENELFSNKKIILNDTNAYLINFWRCIQQRPREFYIAYNKLPKCPTTAIYFMVRQDFNTLISRRGYADFTAIDVDAAAMFYWFNVWGYKGVWRVSARSNFNIPMQFRHVQDIDFLTVEHFSAQFIDVTFTCTDFRNFFTMDTERTLFYCDPPYLQRIKESNYPTKLYTQYTLEGFNYIDHARLADLAFDVADENTTVLISNIDGDETRECYKQPPFKNIWIPRVNRRFTNTPDVEVLLLIGGPTYVYT